MFWKPFWRSRRRAVGSWSVDPPQPEPDYAWKTLTLMNEWIRHSDAKAGVTLAFTGVLATMTFNLAKGFTQHGLFFDVLVWTACLSLFLAGALCGWTLTPRVKDKDADIDAINRLFFASISHNFRGERQRYRKVLNDLTADVSELTNDLADQIHANARIATVKAKSVEWAIRCALFAAALIGAMAIVIGIASH